MERGRITHLLTRLLLARFSSTLLTSHHVDISNNSVFDSIMSFEMTPEQDHTISNLPLPLLPDDLISFFPSLWSRMRLVQSYFEGSRFPHSRTLDLDILDVFQIPFDLDLQSLILNWSSSLPRGAWCCRSRARAGRGCRV